MQTAPSRQPTNVRGGTKGRHRPPFRANQAGHIDNRPFLWILPILAAFATHHLLELKTGKGLFETLLTLPSPWPGFLASVAGVLLAGLAVLAVASRIAIGPPFRNEPAVEGTLLVERRPILTVIGLWVAAFGLTFLVFGLLGEGWLWGLVATLGVAIVAAGALPILSRSTWQLAPGEIVRREWLLGPVRTERWKVPGAASFTLDEHTTGGAFGQPLALHYRVRLGDVTLFEGTDGERAKALLAALRRSYPATEPTGE
ncbi:MAG: hypothetical protein R3298_09960 [Gammaproteobacteria bacterium]|nr:hypothetical protein [Gammaproteobacteria bacterium]